MLKADIDKTAQDMPPDPDPEAEAIRRKVARMMAFSAGTLMVGVMAVLFAIVYKLNGFGGQPAATVSGSVPATAPGLTVKLPANAEIVSHSVSGPIMTFDVRLSDGSREIHLFDMTKNATTGIVRVTQ